MCKNGLEIGHSSKRKGPNLEIKAHPSKKKVKFADPQSEVQTNILTGSWEGDGFFLRLNHAGKHLEGWLTFYNVPDRMHRNTYTISGDLVVNENGMEEKDNYTLFDGPLYKNFIGYLKYNEDHKEIQLTPDSTAVGLEIIKKEAKLKKTSPYPGFSDNTLLAFDPKVQDSLKKNDRTPLLQKDKDAIFHGLTGTINVKFSRQSTLKPSNIRSHIEYYHLASKDEKNILAEALLFIDSHIAEVFKDIHPLDLEEAKRWGTFVLTRELYHLKIDNFRSKAFASIGLQDNPFANYISGNIDEKKCLLAWIYDMLPAASVIQGSVSDKLPNLDKYLGIQLDSKLYHYKVALELGAASTVAKIIKEGVMKGAVQIIKDVSKSVAGGGALKPGLGGGFHAGTITLTELDKANGKKIDDDHVWKQEIYLGEVSFGIGIVLGSTNDGMVSTPFKWTGDNLPGIVEMKDMSVGLYWGVSATGLFIKGNGKNPELVVDLSGTSGTVIGGSIGVSQYVGLITKTGETLGFDVPTETVTKATEEISSSTSIHFPFGSADVLEPGRQLLRIMAAQELAVFMANYETVLIQSHADKPASEMYNLALTGYRSFNTSQVLQDILGNYYKFDKIKKEGLGETEATKAKDLENEKNPIHRRSDIFLNGRLVAQLYGENKI
ncbi:MAG: hypothetical protein ACM31E_01800 [Fibrobacterota bacterium]|nr:hypothetical protein [Chitinispirillaceae bacterium]